ncbi:MAG TPA: PilC/PilY family type IV pilus protein [Burkholderiaceae bacterium]|jgi:type IV pilus assembly protein PilY1
MNIRLSLARFLSLAAASLLPLCAQAAVTDVANIPLIVASPSSVQPNLMFVLDDSGSMNFDFLPDLVNGDGSPDPKLCRSAGATSATATGSFGASCCTNNDESTACWMRAASTTAPFSYAAHAPFMAAGFNGLAYNPATTYLPPVDYTGASAPNVTSFTAVKNDYYNIQSTTSIDLTAQFPDLEWCTDTNYTDCLRNGNYVLPGTVNGKAYTKQHVTTASGSGFLAMGAPEAAGAVAQDFGPYYYNIIPNEYCDAVDLRNCQVGSGTTFIYPAKVRWCSSAANAIAQSPAANSCQAVPTSTFNVPRYPTKYPSVATGGSAYVPGVAAISAASAVTNTITLSISGSGKCNVTAAKLNVTYKGVSNYDLMQGGSTGLQNSGNITNLVDSLASVINNKTGTTAVSANHTNGSAKISLTGPQSTALNGAVVTLTYATSGTCTLSPTTLTFNSAGTAGAAAIPAIPAVAGTTAARFERVDIIPARTSYPRASTRTDCASSDSCTYSEEMTNFANWWTYYHSRMQMMKSATTLAFNGVPTNYRVGYMTINNTQGSAFVNPLTFGASSTARQTWWNKLKAANPGNSTPLRTALAKVGRYYAGKYNGSSINSVTVVDPIQYSCQKNFLLLSTDGFWNETTTPVQLDGSTAIGDQDSSLPLPMKDGNSVASTLADTSAYYYATDLRTGTTGSTACKSANTDDSNKYLNNDVCGNTDHDPVQRMSTFTLGLGASGYMQFRDDYGTATAGDYYAVSQGSTPSGAVCTWQTTGACTWPTPVSNTLTTIDDLWHAAVNGHGTYFSATSPSSLYKGLTSALSAIDTLLAASAAVTTSVPNITATDNQAFLSNFGSDALGAWYGDLQAHRVITDASNGVIGTISSTVDWSASTLLNANTSRTIYMYSPTNGNHRRNFDWASLTTTEQDYFSTSTMASAGLLQFCTTGSSCLSSTDQTAAGGQPVVDYLRGDRTNEGDAITTNKYFRPRKAVLGDIVDSEAAFVGQPTLHLSDAGYSDYKALPAITSRQGVVYVGANDGMLHAFNATTGQEIWAYVPTAVLPNLYKLVDKGYAAKHNYFVDGSPVVRDFYDGSKWRTILVCGLGAGGRAYFAIDVTDPTNPLPLWEFADTNLGYTFGKAEIAKLKSGQWVVMVPSGYNNVSPGDGVGRLYVLDALSGQPATSAFTTGLSTGSGSITTPSNLGHIRAWADNADIDNTALRVYGGDNLGYLWRFDINNNVGAAGIEAQLLATLKTPSGSAAQPITTRPELGLVGKYPMIFVGTGRYMGLADIGDSTPQTIYGIKDKLDATSYGDPRATANKFVQQTLSIGTCPANLSICTAGSTVRSNGSPQAVDLSSNGGWYVDLPATYERDNTDPTLVGGILVVNTNVIDNSKVCTVGGSSWQNFFDYSTGGAAPGDQNVASISLGNAIATRANAVAINGKLYTQTTLSDDTHQSTGPLNLPSNLSARRTSWTELPTQ